MSLNNNIKNNNGNKIILKDTEENKDILIELLICLLESLGYTKGLDESIEESLLYYGIICNPSFDEDNFNILLCIPNSIDIQKLRFQWVCITKYDVRETIKNMKKGFFSYIGESKENYLKNLEETDNITRFIFDISQYDNVLYEHDYNLDICDVIQSLLCEESKCIKFDKTYQIKHKPVITL